MQNNRKNSARGEKFVIFSWCCVGDSFGNFLKLTSLPSHVSFLLCWLFVCERWEMSWRLKLVFRERCNGFLIYLRNCSFIWIQRLFEREVIVHFLKIQVSIWFVLLKRHPISSPLLASATFVVCGNNSSTYLINGVELFSRRCYRVHSKDTRGKLYRGCELHNAWLSTSRSKTNHGNCSSRTSPWALSDVIAN